MNLKFKGKKSYLRRDRLIKIKINPRDCVCEECVDVAESGNTKAQEFRTVKTKEDLRPNPERDRERDEINNCEF